MKGEMNIRRTIMVAVFCAAITGNMLLAGCSTNETEDTDTSNVSSVTSVVSSTEKVESTVSVEEEDTDASYSESDSTKITLNGKSASVEGDGAKADGGTITERTVPFLSVQLSFVKTAGRHVGSCLNNLFIRSNRKACSE